MPKPVIVNLGIDDNILSDQLEAGMKALPRITAQIERVGASISKRITSVLTSLAVPVLAAASADAEVINTLRTTTGATGDQLAALGDIVDSVQAQTGAGDADAAGAVGSLTVQLGLTGSALNSAALAAIRYARAAGQDLHAVTEGIIHVMQAWHEPAGNFEDTAKLLQAAGRDAAGGMVGVAEALTQYEPTLKLAHLSLQDSAALLAQLAHYGVSTDIAMMGLSKAILGFAKGGSYDIARSLQQAFDEIQRAPTDSAAAAIAADFFGKKALKLGEAIRRGQLSLSNIKQLVIPDSQPVETLARAFSKLREQLETALTPLGKAISGVILEAIPSIHALIDAVAYIVKLFVELPVWAQDVIIIVGGMVAAVGPLLVIGGLFVKAAAAVLGAVGLMGTLQIVAAAALIASAVGLFVSFEGVHQKLSEAIPTAKESLSHVAGAISPEVLKGFEPPPIKIEINATIAAPLTFPALPVRTLPAPQLPSAKFSSPKLDLPAIAPNPPLPPLPIYGDAKDPSSQAYHDAGVQATGDADFSYWEKDAGNLQHVPNAPNAAPTIPGGNSPAVIAAAGYAWQNSLAPTTHPPEFPNTPFPNDQSMPLWQWMTAQSKAVAKWWQKMAAGGWLPSSIAPNSWLDVNRPEAWIARTQAERARQANYDAVHLADRQNWEIHQAIDKRNAQTRDQFLSGLSTHLAGDMGVDLSHGAAPSWSGGIKYTPPTPSESPFPVASFPSYSNGPAPIPALASGGIVGGPVSGLGGGGSVGIGGPAGSARPSSLGVVELSAIVSAVASAITSVPSTTSSHPQAAAGKAWQQMQDRNSATQKMLGNLNHPAAPPTPAVSHPQDAAGQAWQQMQDRNSATQKMLGNLNHPAAPPTPAVSHPQDAAGQAWQQMQDRNSATQKMLGNLNHPAAPPTPAVSHPQDAAGQAPGIASLDRGPTSAPWTPQQLAAMGFILAKNGKYYDPVDEADKVRKAGGPAAGNSRGALAKYNSAIRSNPPGGH